MTTQKTFKRRVRDRMATTGESYTAARRQLIASGHQPDPGTPTYETVVSDEKMVEATGKSHEEWFTILDAWGGTDTTTPRSPATSDADTAEAMKAYWRSALVELKGSSSRRASPSRTPRPGSGSPT